MRRLLAIVVLVGTLHAPATLACSCGGRPTPAEAFASTLIFRGTVTKRVDRFNVLRRAWLYVQDLVGEAGVFDEKTTGFLVEFDVQRMWRGTSTRRIKVFTGRGGGDCGVPFEVGKQYLVYGGCDADGDCYTSSCGRTRPIEYAAEDLRYLATR
jgi:hypothetical protein